MTDLKDPCFIESRSSEFDSIKTFLLCRHYTPQAATLLKEVLDMQTAIPCGYCGKCLDCLRRERADGIRT